jgi:cytochrome c-type biogenesis protein
MTIFNLKFKVQAGMDLDINLFGALVAGLLSFASPCVLPLVPPYLCFLAGTSINELSDENMPGSGLAQGDPVGNRLRGRFSTVFVAMGASASFVGSFIVRYMDTLSMVAGVIIIILGLHFLGVFRIGFLYRDFRLEGPKKSVGLFGAYVVGLAFAFGWTPCVGPVLAAILFLAGQEANVLRGALLLLAYALGIGIPFILGSHLLPAVHGWHEAVPQASGAGRESDWRTARS